MSWVKKVIVGVVVLTLTAGAVVGGGLYLKKSNQQDVLVVSVDSLASDYYIQDTNLEGQISTSVSQHVNFENDMIVQQLYVEAGQAVKVGDPLISFDMTLVEMELNIAKLQHTQLQRELNKAVKRLESLKNGGPILESDTDSYDSGGYESDELLASIRPMLLLSLFDGYLFDDGDSADESVINPGNSGMTDFDNQGGTFDSEAGDTEVTVPEEVYPEITDPEVEDSGIMEEDQNLDVFEDQTQNPNGGSSTGGSSSGFDDSEDIFSSGESNILRPSPTPTPVLGPDEDYFDPYTREDEVPGIHDGDDYYYQKLDYNAIPFEGTGTQEDPFIFLCSTGKGQVTVMGSFLNKMAGYTEDGANIIKDGGYWFQLEFHENDTIEDYSDRKISCIGYYLIDGSILPEPIDVFLEMDLTLEDASTYDEEWDDFEYEDDYYDPGYGDPGITVSRSAAIKIQESRVRSLQLDIQESDLGISKLERKLSKQIVYSKLDGIVDYVGDPLTGAYNGEAFLTVKSNEGYFVTGVVSELMLEQLKEGTILNCNGYESGSFDAEVVDVSDYPVSSDYFYYDGNPNVSYYMYNARISDQTLEVSEDDWLNVSLKSEIPSKGSIVLPKAFVKTEDGVTYVYKDDNGVLKKQILTSGGNTDGGYSILIKAGLSRNDKIAFPYGKSVQEGAKTKEGTLDELYGY